MRVSGIAIVASTLLNILQAIEHGFTTCTGRDQANRYQNRGEPPRAGRGMLATNVLQTIPDRSAFATASDFECTCSFS